MVRTAKCILILAIAFAAPPVMAGKKFFQDDPIEAMPAPLPVKTALSRDVDLLYDFLSNSKEPQVRPPTPAGAVNTIGEVPDSSWFTNRHGRQRMSREQLQRGPQTTPPPVPPFTVIGGKTKGITAGFRMRDAEGRVYFVKADPRDYPEMMTATEVIVSRFLYAIGYNTPFNDIIVVKPSDLHLASDAKITMPREKTRAMVQADLEDILATIPKRPDGSIRLMASLKIEGDAIGPFRFQGTRKDDPNDIVPHEDRRDLRGLAVFASWLNHTDMKADNTLDVILEREGSRFIRHYLMDFGSALGSDGDRPKDARLGHEFMLPEPRDILPGILGLGIITRRWERARFPDLRAAGNFEASTFVPDEWKSDYPNPAFLSRRPDDEFWAAKQIMAFTDDDIRAIVETGKYSDPAVVDYMTQTLAQRRDKIGRTDFEKVIPLDNFRVQNNELRFDDLAVRYGFASPLELSFRWSRFDNDRETQEPLPNRVSASLPPEAAAAPTGSYFSTVINAAGKEFNAVTVYIYKTESGYRVVGVERT